MVAHLHPAYAMRPFVCTYPILTGPVSKVHPRKKAQHCASHIFMLSTTTLSLQVPKTVIAKAIAAPTSHGQRMQNLIGDGTPWILLLGVTVATTIESRSVLPAVVLVILELFFFCWSYMYALQLEAPEKPEVGAGSQNFSELFAKCIDSSPNGPEDFLLGWFEKGVSLQKIRREDMQEWLSWACFSSTMDSLVPESNAQVMLILAHFEKRLQHSFPARMPGEVPIPCMRYSIEPFEYTHKPLFYYAVTQGLLGSMSKASLQSFGFRRYTTSSLHYWLRMPESRKAQQRQPIIFVHGIGVGLIVYVNFIRKALLNNDCPVVCIELPFISNCIAPHVPTMHQQLQSVEELLERWDFKSPVFIGHSYGTVLLSWVAQKIPSKVGGLVFIDPVVFLLYLNDVLFNFLYKNEGKSIATHLIGSELFVNKALRRHFWWTRTVLWASDLQEQNIPSLVCLSERDEIGPSSAVYRHILEHERSTKSKSNNVVEAYMLKNVGHGDFCFNQIVLQDLVQRITALYIKAQ